MIYGIFPGIILDAEFISPKSVHFQFYIGLILPKTCKCIHPATKLYRDLDSTVRYGTFWVHLGLRTASARWDLLRASGFQGLGLTV